MSKSRNIHSKHIIGTPEARFWPKVDKNGPIPQCAPELGPCWIWTGAKNAKGYGKFGLSKQDRNRYAHRLAYEWAVGPIPEDKCIDHLCRCTSCVNPSHLEAVRPRTNLMRGHGQTFQARVNGFCLRGHPRTPENSYYVSRDGRKVRICKQCAITKQRERYQSRPGYGRLKEACKNGHERTPENTTVKPNGKRTCRLCEEAWLQKYRSKPTNLKTLRELSDTDISTIRAMRSEGRKVKEIADHFSVTIATVQNIVFGRSWMKR